MNVQCTKAALLLGQAPIEFIQNILPHANADFSCHQCSMLLVQRCTTEMMDAAVNKDWELAAIKLMSLVMILKFGVLDVFKENLSYDGENIRCSEIDYERFSHCCQIK